MDVYVDARTVGHASADALIVHMNAPCSRFSISRWEQLLASTIIGMSVEWHCYHTKFLNMRHNYIVGLPFPDSAVSPEPRFLSYELHSIGGDATNSNVHRECHIYHFVCGLLSLFLSTPPIESRCQTWSGRRWVRKGLCQVYVGCVCVPGASN